MAANSDVIDWATAVRVGRRLHPRGPHVDPAQARAAVDSLRVTAAKAVAPVRDLTGLVAPFDPSDVTVVSRADWIAANVRGVEHAFGPTLAQVRDRGRRVRPVEEVGSRATAAQFGAVLAWLSGKVLGQFDVFGPSGGQLLLVAPTIVDVESALDVPASDFRLWVCLHEETHRVQFTAVPWLSDYLSDSVREFLLADDEHSLIRRLSGMLGTRSGGLVDLLSTPRQRVLLDRLAATMSVLEGHAEVVMDEVGPDVVPSVHQIRARFDDRRAHPGRLDGLLRRLLGMDAKLRQYTEGAAFVRGVVDLVGMSGFNEVWRDPSAVPYADEIADPRAWVRRVCA